MKRTIMFVVLCSLLLVPGTSTAHHSFSATYDTGKTTSIEGKVVQFLLRNPHSFLHVSVIKDGQEQTRLSATVVWIRKNNQWLVASAQWSDIRAE